MKRISQFVVTLLLLAVSSTAFADTISRYARFTGNYNYVATGGSLRTSTTDTCAVGSSSSQALSGVPAGAAVRAAYLYWGGSGATIDSSVSLNGSTVAAGRTFTTTWTNGTTSYPFFGGFANVTSLVTGNGTFTFGNLAVNTGSPHCDNSTVVAGWSLIVVYELASEPLRAINVFDGLEYFRGSAVTQYPDGFRIPASGIDGKMTVVTWDGDPGNSTALGLFSESLTYNGNTLDDGINPAGSDPTVQQYDGTINTLGLDTTYGVDVDTYNISSYLSAGQTSGTSYYSAGNDLVLLTAQVVSVTSEPQIDLSISKTHAGNFTVGSNASYTLHVANEPGVQSVDYLVTVKDTLPTGLTYVSAAGGGWSCSALAQVVTCTHAAPLASGNAFPDITLTVAVGNVAYPSISNTATVSSAGSTDNITGNNTATDVATVLGSNLSTSTKTYVDQNGGDANPGDTLRYTITVRESAGIAATGVIVTDSVPANTNSVSVISYPAGASNFSTAALLDIRNVSVPANGSVTIVFDVTVTAGTSPGATIDNTASVDNPGGVDATPAAPQIIVSQSQIAGSGTKQLYLWSNPDRRLSRSQPSGTHNAVALAGDNQSITWTSTPALQQPVNLAAGNYNVYVWLARTGDNGMGATNRTVSVTLSNSALGNLGTATQTFTAMSTTNTLRTFTLSTAAVTAPTGSTFTLTINNNSNTTATRSISITPYVAGSGYSRVDLNSLSVINVNSVQFYNAAYNGGVVTTSFTRGSTVFVRAVVSDPFGSFDISSATITLRDPSGTDVVTNAAMTQVNDSGAALKTYQYSYVIPANAPAGAWTARVTANEGAEGTISDLGIGTFAVVIPMPALQVGKISSVVWDPINLGVIQGGNPKRIPGSIIEYTITVTNSGPGTVDASSLVMTDALPANTQLCVSAVSQCTAIQFTDGTPVSGLAYGSGNTTYSTAIGGGTPFDHPLSADANGVDAAVTGIRVAPTGSMSAASAAGNPNFTITFRVKVK